MLHGIYLVHAGMNAGVAIILVSVIFSGFLSYFDDNRIKTALTADLSFYPVLCPRW